MKRLVFSCVLALGGCAPTLQSVERVTEIPGQVRVSVTTVAGELFEFEVVNESGAAMIVDRDAVVLITPTGARRREPGGLASTYSLPPGGVHRVNVKFDTSGIHAGDDVVVSFADAVQILPNNHVQVEPIHFTAR